MGNVGEKAPELTANSWKAESGTEMLTQRFQDLWLTNKLKSRFVLKRKKS